MTNENSVLIFYVNGKKVVEPSPDPEWTLLYYLRQKLTSLQGEILARNVADNSFRVPRVRLPGTKLGCAEGGCGACTVMVSKYNRINEKIDHIAVNACLAPVCAMHGLAVTTTEGIGNIKTKLHPVQERIAKAHGSQCGFCTPGIVMSMYTLLRNKPKPTMHDLEVTFQGNLCRCTGYRPIIEGYRTFTTDWEKEQASNMINTNGCPMKDQCCKLKKENETNDEEKLFEVNEFTTYHPTQEPIFPSELKLHTDLDTQVLKFTGKEVKWFRPIKLKQLLELKTNYPNAKLIVGNTEVGVEVKFKKMFYPILIQTNYIPELTEITVSNAGVRVGSSVTLQEMETALKQQIKTKDLYKTRIFAAIVDMLHYFAGKQIRNVAAVGGNIMTSSPISDLNPIFLAANCILEVNSKARGFRKIKMDKDFFTGYRKNKIQSDEVLIAINIPYTEKNQYFYAYKQAKRRDDDIAIVNAAINVSFKENKISDIKLAFGGMAITTVTASKTEEALIGQKWDEQMLEKAYENLIKDLPLSPGAPGGMILYRRSLTLSLFFRVYLAILQQLDMNIPESYKSGITGFKYKVPKSSQYFQVVSNQKDTDLVGQPIVHRSAYKQASGEAIYCDDIPSPFGELYAGLVLSTKSHAEIISIDPSEALKYEGVHGFFYANDLTEHQNKFGMLSIDEEVFASKKVTSQGQIIAVVVAEDQLTAQKAARKIKVEYKDLSPVIITIEDAIQHNSYFKEYKMEVGKVDEAFKMSDHIIEGECRLGAQEHFYLETQCTLAIPKLEDDEMEIISSTQNPTEMAERVAHMLGIPLNRIVSKVKRLGGGFGGKESRSVTVALPIALAAYKLKRPVRCMLDRDEDMMITGQRHPFLMKYKTAFSKDGKITACEIYLYSNAGYSLDLSLGVMERAMLHFQNAYKIPNSRIYGYVCKTNLPSNTALRGFGGPQAMFAAENMIRDIAEFLDKDIIDIAKLNLYKEGDVTHYHQELTYCTLQRCWEECLLRSDYYNQKNEIEEFNKLNRWKKRGIAVVPTMYGIAFTVSFLNQAGALVHVYTDGTVLLTHGGVEMGQGLHTKMIQIASRVLGIPVENIYISETSTDKVPNTTPTAASSASDLNGMAVKNACEKINERLEPFKKKNPNGTFQDWAKAAFLNCVSLSATGYYNIQDIGYNIETNKGRAFNYFTYGVACSVVEVDCLTGDHQVLKTDIVMDLGESLNPAIDIGQVEGAFAQGYGLFTLEEMMYSPTGTIWTRGPGAYKLPGFTDIPIEFNVSLLKGAPNPRAVYSSKAVGEPPLFLSSSILFAIREAIKSARKDAGVKEHFRLNAPATSAKIRMGCIDHLTKKFEIPESGSYIPWNVDP